GWDALTHIGGGRTNNKLRHQVLIVLDPADASANQTRNPVRRFSETDLKRPVAGARELAADTERKLRTELRDVRAKIAVARNNDTRVIDTSVLERREAELMRQLGIPSRRSLESRAADTTQRRRLVERRGTKK